MTVDLTPWLRPGDTVVWGQASAEPLTLTEALVAQRHLLPDVRCVVGIPAAGTAIRSGQVDGLRLMSYCGTGTNAALHDEGRLEIAPVHYGHLPTLLTSGSLKADVVLVQVSAPDTDGRHGLGLGDDYFSAALDTARVVIAEVNDQVPHTCGARSLKESDWTTAIHTSRPPAEMRVPRISDEVEAVARQIADLVPDGATLQYGIGALPEAALRALSEHSDLGIHSGLLNDAAMALMQAGVVTGRRKTTDARKAVVGMVAGTSDLFRFVDRNDDVLMRPTAYTHDATVLASQHQLVAINAALSVDLTGQVNAEVVGGRYVGAVGGAPDFLRGAAASRGGLPITALTSTSRGSSRILADLDGPVSTQRADTGLVVTEHGVADLRGAGLEQRGERLIAVAHPDHRQDLEHALEERLRKGVRA